MLLHDVLYQLLYTVCVTAIEYSIRTTTANTKLMQYVPGAIVANMG